MLFSFVFSASFGQQPLYYRQTITIDTSTNKEELLDRARLWFTTNFTSSKEVIQVADRQYGELVCRGIMPYSSNVFEQSSATKGQISFDVKIYFKTGRYKYEFTNFRHEGIGGYEYFSGAEDNKYPPTSFGLLTTDTLIPKERFNRAIDYRWQNKVWNDLKMVAGVRCYELVELLKKQMLLPAPARKENW